MLHRIAALPHSLQFQFRQRGRPPHQPTALLIKLRAHFQVSLVHLPPQYATPHAESLVLQF